MIKRSDIDQAKLLLGLLDSGDFQLKGNALSKGGELRNWLVSLPERLEEQVKKDSAPKLTKPDKK